MNLITWNMQGATGFGESKWNTDVQRLFNMGAELVCLQEAGNPPPSATPVIAPGWLPGFAPPMGMNWGFYFWNLGTNSRPRIVYIAWLETDPNGHRVNLAIATTIAPTNLICVNNPMGGRPALGVTIPGVANFYTVHAFSGGGADGPGLLMGINMVPGPWFCAGDFNRGWGTWAGLPAAIAICPHNGLPTHPGSGTVLDYAFKQPVPAILGNVMNDFVVSDHYPVVYAV